VRVTRHLRLVPSYVDVVARRTDEAAFRDAVPSDLYGGHYRVVRVGRFVAGRASVYAAAYVLTELTTPVMATALYSTHLLVMHDDLGLQRPLWKLTYSAFGFATLEEAQADLERR